MAYTEPMTWPLGGDLLSVDFNREIRDNFRAMGPHLIARKLADQTQANGVFADDTDLRLSMLAGEVYYVRMFLHVDGPSNASFGFAFPAGSLALSFIGVNSGGTVSVFTFNDTSSPSTSITMDGTAATHLVEGLVKAGASPGLFALRWAGAGGNGTVKQHSSLWGVKFA